MDMFSSSPLMESFPSSRFPSPDPSPSRTEVDFPLEVDQSFNSSMSISGAGEVSPCLSDSILSPSFNLGSKAGPSKMANAASLMSPTGLQARGRPRRPDPVPIQSPTAKTGAAQLGNRRAFGRELSLNSTRSFGPATTNGHKGMMLPPSLPGSKDSIRVHGGIPMKWSSSNEEPLVPKLTFHPALSRTQTDPNVMPSKSSLSGCAMEIDSPEPSSRRPSVIPASPAFSGASSFSGSPGLGSFFCESPAHPSIAPQPTKRRSLVTGSPASPSSPSAKRTSYGPRGMDKANSTSAVLFAATNGGRPNTLASRRPNFKRPTLMSVQAMSERQDDPTAPRSASVTSAYPILSGESKPFLSAKLLPANALHAPMRRAYSVCDNPQMGLTTPGEAEEDESEFENSPSVTIHAEYARRHGQKYTARVDGSPNFKPMRSSFAAPTAASPSSKCKASPYGLGGLPGFGDNEMDGKILPCHKVKEDGLVRITASTLDDLIEGKYSNKIKRFHVLDCRFDYEFNGGHIAGAIHVKSMEMLDELLLSASTGVHADGQELPTPSRSGELEEGEQVVLVFHCEFSAKRAPTFAKHLRSKDRMLNSALYPKIFYPEVYILEGGYSGFYSSHSTRCDPKGYTPMDDPKHVRRRKTDLHDFRKFARTQSFTYGQTQNAQNSLSMNNVRAPVPCPPLAFAAASAAVGRRQGLAMTEEENDEVDSSPIPGSNLPGHQASPCPRVVSLGNAPVFGIGNQPVFGSAKPRVHTRAAFGRVQSFAGLENRP